METQSVIHSTFVIERSYPAKPERVFAALSDPKKKRRWYVDGGGHQVENYELDFRAGGRESARFRFKEGSPLQGMVCENEAIFQDVVPDRRVVAASTMSVGGKHISASLVTFELVASASGTDLIFTHQGAFFEGADGPQMREEGWRKLLDRLDAEMATR